MFERFTKKARKILAIAKEEARNLNHDYLGTEHLLLGLIRKEESIAAKVLRNMDIDLETIRLEIKKEAPPGGARTILRNVSFTPNLKKVLKLAVEETRNMGYNYIGTEHLFFGLIKEEESIGARILIKFGVTLEKARAGIISILERIKEVAEIQFSKDLQCLLILAAKKAQTTDDVSCVGINHLLSAWRDQVLPLRTNSSFFHIG